MWDVRGPDFDELVSGGWWKRPAAAKMPVWEREAPFNLMEGLDLEEEPPGAEDLPPPVDNDVPEGDNIPGGGAIIPYDGGPDVGDGDDDGDDDGDVDNAPDLEPELEGVRLPRMSARERRGVPPLRLIETMVAASEAGDGGAPSSFKEALRGPESAGWKKAFAAEVKSLNDNKVYTVVNKPSGQKVVRAKWVLRRKLLPSGKLDKLKARIVAKGFTQREGIDYEDTFSPTVLGLLSLVTSVPTASTPIPYLCASSLVLLVVPLVSIRVLSLVRVVCYILISINMC